MGLLRDQEYFNTRMSSATMVVERAFGMVKGRLRILMSPIIGDVKTQCLVVGACCVLHNICSAMDQEYKAEERAAYLQEEEQAKKLRK